MARIQQAMLPIVTLFLMLLAVTLLAGCGDSNDTPELTMAEEQALFDQAVDEADGDLAAFAATGVNPCAIEIGESPGHYTFPYENIESLINDIDLIVEGRFGASSMEPLESGKIASRMLVEFEVDEVLLGDSPGREMRLDVGGRVSLSGDRPSRSGRPSFDQCAIEHAILFLNEGAEEGVHNVVAHLAFAGGKSEADPFRELLEEGVAVEDVRAGILRMVEEQQAEGVPKGRLLCESRRNSSVYRDPLACPGDSFNPYDVYGLARPLEIRVRRERGPGEAFVSRSGVGTHKREVVALLALLDRTVSLDAGDAPEGDVIDLSVITTTTGSPPFDVSLRYEVATDWIWVNLGRGGFDAPEGFSEALEALLDSDPVDAVITPATPTPEPGPKMERGVSQRTPVGPQTGSGPEMRLTLVAGGYCVGGDCYASVSSVFILGVEVVEAPSNGYVLLQTTIDYGVHDPTANEDGAGPDSCGDGIENSYLDGADRADPDCVVVDLTYLPTALAVDELFWADLGSSVGLREEKGPGLIGHGGLTSRGPGSESYATGIVVQVQMLCPASPTRVPISLLPYAHPLVGTSGSVFVLPDGLTQVTPHVTPIILHCQ